MQSFLSSVAIVLLSSLTVLGNMWFTYGIWPRSWGSFVLFTFISYVVVILALLNNQEN